MRELNSSEGKERRLRGNPKRKKMGVRVTGKDRVISTLKEEIH